MSDAVTTLRTQGIDAVINQANRPVLHGQCWCCKLWMFHEEWCISEAGRHMAALRMLRSAQ